MDTEELSAPERAELRNRRCLPNREYYFRGRAIASRQNLREGSEDGARLRVSSTSEADLELIVHRMTQSSHLL